MGQYIYCHGTTTWSTHRQTWSRIFFVFLNIWEKIISRMIHLEFGVIVRPRMKDRDILYHFLFWMWLHKIVDAFVWNASYILVRVSSFSRHWWLVCYLAYCQCFKLVTRTLEVIILLCRRKYLFWLVVMTIGVKTTARAAETTTW